ncbi:MAG: ABC transporter permease [Chloroflexi bacterium]|nr:ABC transporter permease [Chloroflexota bacterium]
MFDKVKYKFFSDKLNPFLYRVIPPIILIIFVLLIWEIVVRAFGIPDYVVPSWGQVISVLFQDPIFFLQNTVITLAEAFSGFVLGMTFSIFLAFLMVHNDLLERSIYPIALMVKVTPIVAIAPLIVIWLGFGYSPKIFITFLITFFPVLVNALTGFKSIDNNIHRFFIILNASKWEVFIKLRWQTSIPYLFSAFKISIPLSVIGAVVAEWFTGNSGLGSIILVSNNELQTPTLFAAILLLALIGCFLTFLTNFLEKKIIFWKDYSSIK